MKTKDEDEADDDVDIQRCGVGDSHFAFLPDKPDGNNGCPTENQPGWSVCEKYYPGSR